MRWNEQDIFIDQKKTSAVGEAGAMKQIPFLYAKCLGVQQDFLEAFGRMGGESGSARPLGLGPGALDLCRSRVHASGFGDNGRGSDRLPSGQALENALGILDGIDVAVVILDHLHRRAPPICLDRKYTSTPSDSRKVA
jgi:hypothetical protein